MDNMLEENKNLKSHTKDTPHSLFLKDSTISVQEENLNSKIGSYTKTTKLISALFMVTDILDTDNPLRTKLRKTGADIISDIYSSFKGQDYYIRLNDKVLEILSFIEIATSVGMISEMNSKILTKEFMELKQSIYTITPKKEESWLEEFMKEDITEYKSSKNEFSAIRHINLFSNKSTRIGVQKGGTLLKALSDKIPDLSKTNKINESNSTNQHMSYKHEDISKKRREVIIKIIKDRTNNSFNFNGATISDIKNSVNMLSDSQASILASCGEKTLQRELVSMVSDGILKRVGEKRWSKYSLN